MRYVHTNLIAENWRALSDFYIDVFGCVPAPPPRDLTGPFVEKLSGIPGVRITGQHLRLPGYGANGPTLEVFSYHPAGTPGEKPLNRPGFGHIAFEVEDVAETLEKLLARGGTQLGALVGNRYEQLGTGTFVYARDPEGNIIELQSWEGAAPTPPDGR